MDPRDTAGELSRNGITKSDILNNNDVEKIWGAALKYGAKILPKAKSIAAKGIKRARRYGKKWKKYPTGRKVLTAAAMGGEIGFASELAGKLKRKKRKSSGYKIGGE